MKSKEGIYHEELGAIAKGCHEVVKDAILRAMESYASQDRWISVEDALPELDYEFENCSIEVIVSTGIKVHAAFYGFKSKKWILSEFYQDVPNVTHWQPLPAPHKTQE